MITSGQYLTKASIFLNELKNSISKEKKDCILSKSDDETNQFINANSEEISNFLKATPRKRKATKKWQEHYDLYTYSAYIMLLETFNQYLIINWRFHSNSSYREDLAKIGKLIFTHPRMSDLFFEDKNHNEEGWPG